ncbi:MAG TPA: glutathione S-transferase family protein [Arenimonas sp.]|nr:glutathione S-transferase family protein [Arenimonas sp.]
MSLELVIGNKNYSSWSLRPWLLMSYFDLPFNEVKLPLDTPEFYQRIGQYSPTARVPVLRDGDETIWDSLAICEVVNERYLDGKAWPQDLKTRAAARCAVAEMHSGFSALRTQLPMNCHRNPDAYRWKEDADRDIARIQSLWNDLRHRFGNDGQFLCGEFGIVDAMFAPVCVRFKAYGVAMDDNAARYVDSIYQLPAMQAWLTEARIEPPKPGVGEP